MNKMTGRRQCLLKTRDGRNWKQWAWGEQNRNYEPVKHLLLGDAYRASIPIQHLPPKNQLTSNPISSEKSPLTPGLGSQH